MGCVSSKQARAHSPPPRRNSSLTTPIIINADITEHNVYHVKAGFAPLEKIKEEPEKEKKEESLIQRSSSNSKASKKGNSDKKG
ncbi:hypothetical protein KY285_016171 [Solanum tuberosum]|nr:hypothetical protein KY285_016171 [Solanum tuberosum]